MTSPSRSPRYRKFLDRLKSARLEAGLTQDEVGRKLRKPQSYISKCESGERRVDVVELEQFGELYGRPFSYFLPPEIGLTSRVVSRRIGHRTPHTEPSAG